MNSTSRVPGITRNSGWQAVDAEIAARKAQTATAPTAPQHTAQIGH